ncbi:kinesin-like protein KIN-14A [Eucalyptus grandis]|uniref:kinesin-like protein KIN-14A n=1 Tax=Eucalyptus grandis TaxID=71139 RepID=UPI00192ED7F3|nr:kinesin-like protein KIN-14A [Eucalyptus grandis]
MQGERTLCTDPRTPNLLVQSMNGKESHIRKSLHTIGRKLINGFERRNQRNVTEARSPVRGSTTCIKNGVLAIAANTRTQNGVLAIAANTRTQNGVFAIAANTRTLRRQSLTGAGSDQSRRSSLGGKSTNSNVKDTRNAKTPPPVHPLSTIAKRWL